MALETREDEKHVARRVRRSVGFVGALVLAVAVLGVVAVLRFVEGERERDLNAWQIRLGIVADSRAAAIRDWLDQQLSVTRQLAENISLQLYMTELSLAGGDRGGITDEAAQAQYLRNLLVATADRTGFTDRSPGLDFPANVERVGNAGLALTDDQGRVLVATPTMSPIEGPLLEFLRQIPRGTPAIYDIRLGASGEPIMGLIAPIFAIQEDPGTSDMIGMVVGLRPVGPDFFNRLKQPGETEATAETYLVRAAGNAIEYLSPLRDGTPPLKRTFAADTPELAAAFAIEKPGGFGIKRDYSGNTVLVAGRAIAGVPWALVRKVDESEALGASESRLRWILTVLLLAILAAGIAIVAVWRHGTSLREAEAAARWRTAAERFENRGKFLRLVTDSLPAVIAALEINGRFTFANRRAGQDAEMEQEAVLGKSIIDVMGPLRGGTLQKVNRRVLSAFKETGFDAARRFDVAESHVFTFERADSEQTVRSSHIPLRPSADYPPTVLMILEDVSDLIRERQRRERTFQALVDTLVAIVDKRHPYTANQSARIAEVARAIAEEMGLDDSEIDTAEIAGKLMSLGKMFVPIELLSKETLADEERRTIAESVVQSADLLKDIDFDGPVAETIRQVEERFDGAGFPKGIRGEDILMTARIVAVANAFVQLVSTRDERAALPVDDAASKLLAQIDKQFDRRPVSALLNFINNRGGREKFAN